MAPDGTRPHQEKKNVRRVLSPPGAPASPTLLPGPDEWGESRGVIPRPNGSFLPPKRTRATTAHARAVAVGLASRPGRAARSGLQPGRLSRTTSNASSSLPVPTGCSDDANDTGSSGDGPTAGDSSSGATEAEGSSESDGEGSGTGEVDDGTTSTTAARCGRLTSQQFCSVPFQVTLAASR